MLLIVAPKKALSSEYTQSLLASPAGLLPLIVRCLIFSILIIMLDFYSNLCDYFFEVRKSLL